MAKTTKARKGDLIVVKTTTHDYVIGQPVTARVEYDLGVVASATRDGEVKTWASVGWGEGLISTDHAGKWCGRPLTARQERWVMAQGQVDVEAALRTAKAHHWPGHPGQPMAYASLEEVREAIRPHLRVLVRN